MDPITGALIGGGASLIGDYMQNKSNEKLADQSAKNRAQEIGMIKQYGQRATESMLPAYQAAQGARQQGMDASLGLAGQTFRPMIETMQTGDYMAQQALLAGMMGQRNAILGDSINYGALQAQSVPMDYSQLTGLTNPQGLDFKPFEQIEYSNAGVMDWDANTAQKYLSANPDVLEDYNANKAKLLEGGDPQFRTAEGYAKWHWDNYGREGGRSLEPGEASTPAAGAQNMSFSGDQVAKALGMMGGETP
tara:strand:- start:3647 stop:4393 length:747 start_codon:yes stop_codon:yes gene_type:complete